MGYMCDSKEGALAVSQAPRRLYIFQTGPLGSAKALRLALTWCMCREYKELVWLWSKVSKWGR